jgi:hypothetical protein
VNSARKSSMLVNETNAGIGALGAYINNCSKKK